MTALQRCPKSLNLICPVPSTAVNSPQADFRCSVLSHQTHRGTRGGNKLFVSAAVVGLDIGEGVDAGMRLASIFNASAAICFESSTIASFSILGCCCGFFVFDFAEVIAVPDSDSPLSLAALLLAARSLAARPFSYTFNFCAVFALFNTKSCNSSNEGSLFPVSCVLNFHSFFAQNSRTRSRRRSVNPSRSRCTLSRGESAPCSTREAEIVSYFMTKAFRSISAALLMRMFRASVESRWVSSCQ